MKHLKLIFASLVLAVMASAALAGPTVCRKDEQHGCFTFQIIGASYNAGLMAHIDRLSSAEQAKSLGMDVLKGMQAGRYQVSAKQDYVLYLWMDKSWGRVPLPKDRIVQLCYANTAGKYTAYVPRGLSKAQLGGSLPEITDSRYGALGTPHTALLATCSGGVGAGWVIPKDVMAHVVFAMICPKGGPVAYPFTNPGTGTRQGIIHTTDEIHWYLRQGLDYVLSAAVWRVSALTS